MVWHPHTSKMSSVMPNYHPANQTMGAQLISSFSHLSTSHLFCGYLPLCWATAFSIMWEDISLINLFPWVDIYLPHYCHRVYECPRLAFVSSSQSQLCWICLICLLAQVQASPVALPLLPELTPPSVTHTLQQSFIVTTDILLCLLCLPCAHLSFSCLLFHG